MSADRRSHPRRSLPTADSNPLVATVGLLPRTAIVCDVSARGIGVLLTDPPAPGTLVPVWLPGVIGEPSLMLLAQVAHVSADSGPLFRVGLACIDTHGQGVLGEVIRRRATLA